jgi:hypothetical protein
MSDELARPSVLPPELAALEAAMRAEPPAPPPALLDRITATRDGVVVTFAGPEPFIPEERPGRRRGGAGGGCWRGVDGGIASRVAAVGVRVRGSCIARCRNARR